MQPTRRTDIDIKIDAVATPDRVVTMTISLTNNSPNDYYIAESIIFKDKNAIKSFIMVEGPSKIRCEYSMQSTSHAQDYSIKLFFSPHGGTIANSILLSDMCNFRKALPGTYTATHRGSFHLYNEDNKASFYTKIKYGGDSKEYSCFDSNSSFVIGESRPPVPLSEAGSSDF